MLVAFGTMIVPMAGVAQTPVVAPDTLIASLRQGGYVLVMRHASSPREAPDRRTAHADNTNLERQLDAAGRAGA